jgi:hypothetical protein
VPIGSVLAVDSGEEATSRGDVSIFFDRT